jgi:gliding motility-associated lipoprotein GldH
MRSISGFVIILLIFASCDEQRVYEKNTDFDSRHWLVNEKPTFEFEIADSLESYNLYCNVRNSLDYPFARIFITYYLQDSTGAVMEKNMVSQLLFDEKTGAPFGESGLGDLYDHRILLKKAHTFPSTGKYAVSFEQYMRKDTLDGILAVGLRVEKDSPAN